MRSDEQTSGPVYPQFYYIESKSRITGSDMDYTTGGNEKELLLRISKGDEVAFREIFDQYTGKIYSFSMYLTRSEFLAEDITQEVFLKIWTNRQKLTEVEYFYAYLKTIAKNIFSTYLRRLALEKLILKDLSSNEPPAIHSTEISVDGRELHRILENAIKQLPPQQKKVYLLGRQENLSYDEIAELLKISTYTVKEHMQRALAHIRNSIRSRADIQVYIALFILLKK
jgi:RNA polymerase sigma-70 factor (family 1)